MIEDEILQGFLEKSAQNAMQEIKENGNLSEKNAMSLLLKAQFNHIAHLDESMVTKTEFYTKFDGLKQEFNTRFDGLRGEVNAKIDGLRGEINTKIDSLKQEFNGLKESIDIKINQLNKRFDTMMGVMTLLICIILQGKRI